MSEDEMGFLAVFAGVAVPVGLVWVLALGVMNPTLTPGALLALFGWQYVPTVVLVAVVLRRLARRGNRGGGDDDA